MSKYDKGMQILESRFGNYKDNIIALATISLDLSADNNPMPCVRDVDAFYEDGVFYVTTNSLSNKVKQIINNPEVSISVNYEDFFSSGRGVNLGWVLDPKNAEIRNKIRKTFANWYDEVTNENDVNSCILAIYLTKGTLRIDHGVEFYHFDFVNKIAE